MSGKSECSVRVNSVESDLCEPDLNGTCYLCHYNIDTIPFNID